MAILLSKLSQVADDSKHADRGRHRFVYNAFRQQVAALSRRHVRRPENKQVSKQILPIFFTERFLSKFAV